MYWVSSGRCSHTGLDDLRPIQSRSNSLAPINRIPPKILTAATPAILSMLTNQTISVLSQKLWPTLVTGLLQIKQCSSSEAHEVAFPEMTDGGVTRCQESSLRSPLSDVVTAKVPIWTAMRAAWIMTGFKVPVTVSTFRVWQSPPSSRFTFNGGYFHTQTVLYRNFRTSTQRPVCLALPYTSCDSERSTISSSTETVSKAFPSAALSLITSRSAGRANPTGVQLQKDRYSNNGESNTIPPDPSSNGRNRWVIIHRFISLAWKRQIWPNPLKHSRRYSRYFVLLVVTGGKGRFTEPVNHE